MIFSDSFLKQPLLKIDFQNWVTNRLQKYFLGFSNNHLEVVKIRKKINVVGSQKDQPPLKRFHFRCFTSHVPSPTTIPHSHL